MTRSVLLIVALFAALVPMAASAAPVTQVPGCRFVLGFAALRAQIPQVVGDCLENEHHNPTNGDTLQRTSGGLLVWRKSDNFTAFTDGHRTWVAGPAGLQARLNTERFAWERDPIAGECTPETVVAATRARVRENLTDVVGEITNNCREAVNATLDLDLRNGGSAGALVMEAPSIYFADLGPGQSRPFSTRIVAMANQPTIVATVAPVPTRLGTAACFHFESACIPVDPRVHSALGLVAGIAETRPLVSSALAAGTRVRRLQIGDALGAYSPRSRTVFVGAGLDSTGRRVRATVLAHELRHAADHAAGRLPVPGTAGWEQGCYRAERDAFTVGGRTWALLWQGRLPPDVDAHYAEMNRVARSVSENPAGLAQAIERSYHSACSGVDED